MLKDMPDETTTPREVAERIAQMRDGLQEPPGVLGERELGRLDGAADVAELALRLLARVPGVPDYSQGSAEQGLASVHRLHERRDER